MGGGGHRLDPLWGRRSPNPKPPSGAIHPHLPWIRGASARVGVTCCYARDTSIREYDRAYHNPRCFSTPPSSRSTSSVGRGGGRSRVGFGPIYPQKSRSGRMTFESTPAGEALSLGTIEPRVCAVAFDRVKASFLQNCGVNDLQGSSHLTS